VDLSEQATPLPLTSGANIMKRLLSIAAAGFVFAAGAAGAEVAAGRTSAAVAYLDLDLSSPAGRATLERRIDRAVEQVCGERPEPRKLRLLDLHRACIAEAREGSRRQLAKLFGNEALAEGAIRVAGPVR
jgi:UrcA family protein